MTTNQTIDGVPRDLLKKIEAYINDGLPLVVEELLLLSELRALLDAPPRCPVCGYTEQDCREQMDHYLCGSPEPAPANKRAAQPQGEPFGYWLFPHGLPLHGMFHRVTNEDKVIDSQSVMDHFDITPLYAEQPAPVAVASLEVVGRQCFPSEAMKAIHGYRKEPWVDGDVDQVPSEPGFYRVEPLVRLSDVTRLNPSL